MRAARTGGSAAARPLRALAIAGIATAILCWQLKAAAALEAGAGDQYGPCFLCGSAPATPLPPGWYLYSTTAFQSEDAYDNSGNKLPVHADAFIETPELVWFPNIPLVLGAYYGAAVLQPLVHITVTSAGQPRQQRTGITDTVVVPVFLSWRLPNRLFLSAAFAFYAPDGTYSSPAALDIGDNYWTFEPDAAVSYVGDGLNLSLHGAADFNTEDGASHTTTGDIFYLDYTALKDFSGWSLGVVGDWVAQLTRDVGPAARPPELKVSVGPDLSHQFGKLKVHLFYVRDLVTRNAFGGDHFWLRLTLPL